MTLEDRRSAVYIRDGGICHICGGHVGIANFHLDHLVPRSKGGSNDLDNLGLSHPGCNISKGNRQPGDKKLTGQINVYLDPSEIAVLAQYAADNDRSMASVARLAIRDYFGL